MNSTYCAASPVAILGQHHKAPLGTFLRVMQGLLWLENMCAQSGPRWNAFKQGVAEALQRDKTPRRPPGTAVRLRLGSLLQRPEDADLNLRQGLRHAGIAVTADGQVEDAETERILQAAIQFHCGGGCQNVGYVALPLRNDDILDMLAEAARTQGADTLVTIWNPSQQTIVINGVFNPDRQLQGHARLGTYLEVWRNLRNILKSGKDNRDQVLKRLGGGDRDGFFAQHGIDCTERIQARIVAASLRRFCPPNRGMCNARMRLSHAIQPHDFVNLMRHTIGQESTPYTPHSVPAVSLASGTARIRTVRIENVAYL